MKFMISLISLVFITVNTTLAASTNLSYSAAQINAALGYGLANSNTPQRLTSIESFLGDSPGFSGITNTTAEITNAIAIAEANVDSVSRLDFIEANILPFDAGAGLADVVFTNALVLSDWSSATYTNIDLSPWIGTNASMTILSVTTTNTTAEQYFCCRRTGLTFPVIGGVGRAEVTSNGVATVYCTSSTNGSIDATCPVTSSVTLVAFVRPKEEL